MAAKIFFAAASTAAACSPDLARQSGVLELRVVGLPADARTVTATIGQGINAYFLTANVASFDGALVAESVPFGDVSIRGEAITPTGPVRASDTVHVDAALKIHLLDFGGALRGMDAGMNAPRTIDSDPIGHVIHGISQANVTGDQLSASVSAGEERSLSVFMETMTTAFGAPPAAIGVRSVALDLLEETSNRASDLRDLLDGGAAVSLVPRSGGSPVELAAAALVFGTAPVPLQVSADRDALAPILSDLLASRFDVRVTGRHTSGGDFTADVRVTINYIAYER